MKYKGPDRRRFHSRKGEIVSIIMRILREGTQLKETQFRSKDNVPSIKRDIHDVLRRTFDISVISEDLRLLVENSFLTEEDRTLIKTTIDGLVLSIRERLKANEQQLVEFQKATPGVDEALQNAKKSLSDPVYGDSIDELLLGKRVDNVLRRRNIHLIGELVQIGDIEIRKLDGIGPRTYKDINNELKTRGLRLGMKLSLKDHQTLAEIRNIISKGAVVGND
jgi:hypothetical protein